MRARGLGKSLARAGNADQAWVDTEAHCARIKSNGGTAITPSEKNNLYLFARALYAIAGQRVDFWPLRSQHNMGSGSTCYSFLGAVGTLTNGPTWGTNGVTCAGSTTSGCYISVSGQILPTTPTGCFFQAFQVSSSWNGATEPVGNNLGGGWSHLGISYLGNCVRASDDYNTPGTAWVVNLPSNPFLSWGAFGVNQTGERAADVWINGDKYTAAASDKDWSSFGSVTSSIVAGYTNGANSGSKSITTAISIVLPKNANVVSIYAAFKRYLGVGLGLPNSVLDDLNAYVSSVAGLGGNISATEQANLLSFATQLYALCGRCDFWALRSGQNVGTGSTCVSWLGLTGTLVNGPLWTPDGISSTAAGGVPPNITLSGTSRSGYTTRTWVSVFKPIADSTGGTNVLALTSGYSSDFPGNGQGMGMGFYSGFSQDEAGTNGASDRSISPALPFGSFHTKAISYNSGALRSDEDTSTGVGSVTVVGTVPSTLTDSYNIRLMGMNAGSVNDRGLNGTMSAFVDIAAALSPAQYLSIHDAYVSTIGQNLGLATVAQQDLAAYVAAVAALGGSISPAEQANLLAFATRLYAICGQRVDFWALRSTQNVGTGATALSWLGQSATLVNGALWGVNGIIQPSGSSAHLSVNTSITGSVLTAIAVVESLPFTGSDRRIISMQDASLGGTHDYDTTTGAVPLYFSSTSTQISSIYDLQLNGLSSPLYPVNQWQFAASRYSGTVNSLIGFDSGGLLNRQDSTLSSPISLASTVLNFGAIVGGSIASAIVTTTSLSDAQITAIHAADKYTIGQNLSLP